MKKAPSVSGARGVVFIKRVAIVTLGKNRQGDQRERVLCGNYARGCK